MADLEIENLIRGLATGNYTKQVGSQFGSLWGWDGLMAMEATPEEYAAFGAARDVQICHGKPLNWFGQEWSTILAYPRGALNQVNIHSDPNDAVSARVHAWLESSLGKGEEHLLPGDEQQSVQRRVVWYGQDGSVSLICTPSFQQVSIGQTRDTRPWWKFWG
jgi:hypothetical protein